MDCEFSIEMNINFDRKPLPYVRLLRSNLYNQDQSDSPLFCNQETHEVYRYFYFVAFFIPLQGTAQRFALPALGRGRRSRPARKMKRRVKLLGMCAESPASGARFVRWRFI